MLPPAALFVDPQKEADAYNSLVRSVVMTLSQVVALHGGDFDEQMRQREREIKSTKKMGIVLDTDPGQVSSNGVFQPSLFSTSEENTSNENESQDEGLD